MNVALIAAMTPETHIIGNKGDIPWHVSSDLKRFKQLTLNSTIIMGRKTYESIGKPLPKRRNIVLTRNKDFKAEGCDVFSNLYDALKTCSETENVNIIGGGEIYKKAMNVADQLLLSFVMAPLDMKGDAYFPRIGPEWNMTSIEFCEKQEKDDYDHYYAVFERY